MIRGNRINFTGRQTGGRWGWAKEGSTGGEMEQLLEEMPGIGVLWGVAL